MKKSALVSMLAMLAAVGTAHAGMGPGDVFFVGANADEPENFAFVLLAPVSAGTSINFTDSSYGSDGAGEGDKFRDTEHLNAGGPFTWTATSDLAAGTVVKYIETAANTGSFSTGSMAGTPSDFSTGGEQIFAYTGAVTEVLGGTTYRDDTSGTTFLGALGWGVPTGWLTSGIGPTSTSYLPAPLAGELASQVLSPLDNVYYSGPTSFASVAEARQALADPMNWTGDDVATFGMDHYPMRFTIPTPGSIAPLGLGGLLGVRRRR